MPPVDPRGAAIFQPTTAWCIIPCSVMAILDAFLMTPCCGTGSHLRAFDRCPSDLPTSSLPFRGKDVSFSHYSVILVGLSCRTLSVSSIVGTNMESCDPPCALGWTWKPSPKGFEGSKAWNDSDLLFFAS